MEDQNVTDKHSFKVDDPAWLEYLDKNGYVVVEGVADTDQIEESRNLFWKHFEHTNNVDRHSISTWSDWRLDRRGILVDSRVVHSEGAWLVRCLPKVKAAFQQIWGTPDLIVSMDSLILWLPWWKNIRWLPLTEGLHVDQNPFQKPGKCCFQGMVTLTDVTSATGGLEVVPGSHLRHTQLRELCPWMNGTGDFCTLRPKNPLITSRKLVLAKAGDLILWDSRTIHGGMVGTGYKNEAHPEPPQLARLAMTVCMVPRSTASAEVQEGRKDAYLKGYGLTHWPNEMNITSYPKPDYKPVPLTPEQLELV